LDGLSNLLARFALAATTASQALFSLGAASAVEYQITEIGSLAGLHTLATGINSSGQVVGFSDVVLQQGGVDYSAIHAFLYDGATIRDLTPLPGTKGYWGSYATGISDNGSVTGAVEDASFYYAFSFAGNTMNTLAPVSGSPMLGMYGASINSSGQIVGQFSEFSSPSTLDGSGFYFDGTTSVRIPTLGGWGTTAAGINEQGQITGSADVNELGFYRAYIYDGTTIHDLGTLANGLYYSQGIAINELGQVTGWSYDTNFARRAFFHDGLAMHDLGALDGTISVGLDINDYGQIVGEFVDASGFRRGFLYDPLLGMMALDDLLDPSLGWIVQSGVGINNAGQIAVNAYRPGEVTQALILTPVPEPSTCLLAASGVASAALLRRRRSDICRSTWAVRNRLESVGPAGELPRQRTPDNSQA